MRYIFIILGCAAVIFTACNTNPKSVTNYQSKPITASFSLDDSSIAIDRECQLTLINGEKVDPIELRGDSVILPSLLTDTGYTISLKWKNEILSFSHLPKKALIRNQQMVWEFGIDNPPFNKLLGLVPTNEYEIPKFRQLQYLIFNPSEFDPGTVIVNKIN
jgi:hypothetical protein